MHMKSDSATRTTAFHLCFCCCLLALVLLLGFRTESLADTCKFPRRPKPNA